MTKKNTRDDQDFMIQDMIFKKMKRQGMTQAEFARRLGVSPAAVQRWKNHERMISMRHAEHAFMILRDDTKLDIIRAMIGEFYY